MQHLGHTPVRPTLERLGERLFRWRSYVPLGALAVELAALPHARYPAGSHRLELAWEVFCGLTALAGLTIRVLTVGFVSSSTSSRSTRSMDVPALNTRGLYSVLRHPLYLGNYLMWLGVAAVPRSWGLLLLANVLFWTHYGLIVVAEEARLRRTFGTAFLEWAARTPAFVPRPRLWRPPDRPFSIREVLRREGASLFALVSCFTVLHMVGDALVEGRVSVDPVWSGIFGATAIFYGVTIVLKRRTSLLRPRD